MFGKKDRIIGIDGYYYECANKDKTISLCFTQVRIYKSGKVEFLDFFACLKSEVESAPDWVKFITKHQRLLDC